MTTKMDEFLNQIRDAHSLLARARADAGLDGPVAKDMDSVIAVLDGALTFASTWGLGAEPDPNLTLRISTPGTVAIGQIRDEVVGFIDRISEGQFHGIEYLIHETLHARRPLPRDLTTEEDALDLLVDSVSDVRRVISDVWDGDSRTERTTALVNLARGRLDEVLSEVAASRRTDALRDRLVELVSIRNVGGPTSPKPYPGSVDDVADEIAVFVDELDHGGSARGLSRRVADRLANLDRQRVEQERQRRIAVVLKGITDEHLRPALAELGIAVPEGYVLQWRGTGDVTPGE